MSSFRYLLIFNKFSLWGNYFFLEADKGTLQSKYSACERHGSLEVFSNLGTLVQISSQNLCMLLFLLVLVWDFVADELSQQDAAACCWCCVRWGLSRCAAGIMNCPFFSLACYTPLLRRSSQGNPWHNVSNISVDAFSLSSFLNLLGPQMHPSFSSCNLLWGAGQSVLYCAVSDPCMELRIGLCRHHPPC